MDEIWDETGDAAGGCVEGGCGCLVTFGLILWVAILWKIGVWTWDTLFGDREYD